jgi:hypothetical protein
VIAGLVALQRDGVRLATRPTRFVGVSGPPSSGPPSLSPLFECEKVAARPRWLEKEGTPLGCIFVLIALLSSRLALALMWIFTPWVDRAFGPLIWPILGIIFLPLTTLLYVILWNTGGRGVTGWEWIFVILAVFVDVASHGASARRRAAF